jgi:hypothetical protein
MPSQILLYEWGRVFLTIAWSNSRPLFKALKSTGQEFIIAGAHEEVRVYCVENKTKRDKGQIPYNTPLVPPMNFCIFLWISVTFSIALLVG